MAITKRVRLAAIFSSFTILACGGLSLFNSMSINYYTVLGALKKVIPAVIALGSLGWVMGMILDAPKRKKITAKKYKMAMEMPNTPIDISAEGNTNINE